MGPTHEDVIAAIDGLRAEIAPLVRMAPKLEAMAEIYSAATVGGRAVKWLEAMAEIYSAATVGGRAVKWLAGIGTGLVGVWAFMKLLAGELVR